MYCPACKAEYRQGFTECTDCHVALVDKLPREGAPEAYRVVWQGENTVFASQLAEELENAGIESVTVPLDVLARNRRDFFDVAEKPLFGSAVSVHARDFKAAARVKEKLLEQEPDEDEGAFEESASKATAAAQIPDLPSDWDRASATVELWRGDDEGTLKFVEDALHNVGVPTREEVQGDGGYIVLVRPEDAARGGEIVQEVVEGRPPL